MRRHAALLLLAVSACLGTTGNHLVTFRGAAAGPADAVAGAPLRFTNGQGWNVVLTKATVHVGAMYLVQTLPTSGGGPHACILPETYVAQVVTEGLMPAGIDVDVLSPSAQYFPAPGQGTDLEAKAGQVWLTGVDVDAPDDLTPILDAEGTAEKDGASLPFFACLTIGSNRAQMPTNSAEPGSNPICLQRVVSPIPVSLVPQNGGTLLLRIDPRPFFVDVDFSDLALSSTKTRCPFDGQLPVRMFADESTDTPSTVLYSALRSAGSQYEFSWQPSSP
jgi:hypothetical protein